MTRADRVWGGSHPPEPIQMVSCRALTPEQRLLAAVLTDALTVLRGGGYGVGGPRHRAALLAHLRAWIDGADAPLMFVNVCDGLGLDVAEMRAALLARCRDGG